MARQERKTNPLIMGCAAVLGLFLLIFILIFIAGLLKSGGGSGGSLSQCEDKTTAFVMSQSFVKKRLRAPATAEFPWITDSEVQSNGVPHWWTSYNKVKHARHDHFGRASLKNALNSVAGLFVIVLYLYKEKATLGELAPPPQLLHVDAEHHGGMSLGGQEIGLSYNL